MKWSINIGQWLGIPVKLHVTFILVLGLFATASAVTGGGLTAAINTVIFLTALFACVLLHEFGHALMARRYGVGTKDITLLPIGGLARLERMPDKPVQEFWIALAGPAVNILIAGLLGLWVWITRSGAWPAFPGATGGGLAESLLVINLFLVLFNMLPAFPMDGGRVLRSVLAMRMNYVRATHIAGRLGQGMAFLFGLIGLFWNPMLLLIAVFVWTGASQEMDAAKSRSVMAGVTVADAMETDFDLLSVDDRLGDVARRVLAGTQADYPVMDGNTIVGMLDRTRLMRGLNGQGADRTVATVMSSDFPLLDGTEPVADLLARQDPLDNPAMPVFHNDRLVGLFTLQNLSELLMVREALAEDASNSSRPDAWRGLTSRPPWIPVRGSQSGILPQS